MPFNLQIGTERATALQASVQEELGKRGWNPDPDCVMAEYITIMVINNKTSAQITAELDDLIGSDFDPSFTEWLFAEAAKGSTELDSIPQSSTAQPETAEPSTSPEAPPANETTRTGHGPRSGVYQHAISQALPSGSGSAQKRSASARSPSPSHPNKSRRTDLPTGPRAMYHRDGSNSNHPHPNGRSLLERVGGPAGRGPKNFQRDEIQARIDNIVGNAPDHNMMLPPGFPGMGMGMDMNAMASMANPLMLQEMMMNQMALMAQMATSMGIINPAAAQFGGQPGFPMQQGGMPDMNMMQNMNNGFQQQPGGPNNNAGRGRGGARGGRGVGRGRGAAPGNANRAATNGKAPSGEAPSSNAVPIVAPSPITPAPSSAPSASERVAGPAPTQLGYAIPERPQSPTLCKFALKCTNAHCRYSHPSPVATPESGVVLSNEACEKGKECKDKDCLKAHVSPAVLNPQAEHSIPHAHAPAPAAQAHHTPIPCRFGAACTRPGCTFSHPQHQTQGTTPCRFGTACTRAQCPFQHPEGRVLPSSFHRGLSTTGPIVNVPTPEPGTMGASQNRSVTFNNPVKDKLAKQMKEIQEKKLEAEKAVADAEAAATNKKAEAKPAVSITA
ncbi:hypothetical protein CPC08DRAFT_747879 [Agrocybe pediades]|nr:hypothetical protein CPC08DRAFT_747879 [Agrocybe pediades]